MRKEKGERMLGLSTNNFSVHYNLSNLFIAMLSSVCVNCLSSNAAFFLLTIIIAKSAYTKKRTNLLRFFHYVDIYYTRVFY